MPPAHQGLPRARARLGPATESARLTQRRRGDPAYRRVVAAIPNQRGAASVEVAGLAMVVAALMSAIAIWAAREMRPPEHPPALIDEVAAAIEPPGPPAAATPPGGARWQFPSRDGLEPIPAALAWFGRRHLEIFGPNQDALALAFLEGAAAGARQELESIAGDPAGELIGLVGLARFALTSPNDPRTVALRVRLMLETVRDAADYVVDVYADEDPRHAARRVGRDGGELAADLAIGRGKRLARKRVREILRERLERRRPPQPREPNDG